MWGYNKFDKNLMLRYNLFRSIRIKKNKDKESNVYEKESNTSNKQSGD